MQISSNNNTLSKIHLKISKLVDKRTFFFFLLVGASSAFAYFLSFTILFSVYHLNYKIAVSISYFLSILVHFMGNRILTFQSHGAGLPRHLSRYIVMVVINYLITLMVMHLIVSQLQWTPYLGIVISIAITMGTGYLLAKFWVFTKKTQEIV